MSDVPGYLRFAESHEWARLEADGLVTVGLSDYAQEALGDVVFVEPPRGRKGVRCRRRGGCGRVGQGRIGHLHPCCRRGHRGQR
ncbi:glycine cleavage system protein H [Streptomyces sp. NPDC057575]|uniref:glycine cleavage system protein H n=1 Tax=unclassified Streptomyces TaxID=2593676 RepID=UPI0036B954AE